MQSTSSMARRKIKIRKQISKSFKYTESSEILAHILYTYTSLKPLRPRQLIAGYFHCADDFFCSKTIQVGGPAVSLEIIDSLHGVTLAVAVNQCVEIYTPTGFHSYTAHRGKVQALCTFQKRETAHSDSGSLLASGGWDRDIMLMDVQRTALDKETRTVCFLKGHTQGVNCISTVDAGHNNYLASGSDDATVRIWDVEEQSCVLILPPNHQPFPTDLDNNALAVLYDAKKKVNSIKSLSGPLLAVAAGPDIQLWDIRTPQLTATLQKQKHQYRINSLESLNSNYLASGSNDRNICVWDIRMQDAVSEAKLAHKHWVTKLQRIGDTGYLASCSIDQTIKIWDWTRGGLKCVKTMSDHKNWVADLALLPGNALLSCSWDGAVRIWDPQLQQTHPARTPSNQVVT